MTVVLDDDIGMFGFDSSHYLPQSSRTTYARHILKAYLLCACLNELFSQVDVVLNSMYRRMCYTHRRLRCHACFFSPFDRRNNITRVIKSAEDTCYIYSLRVLNFVHQLSHVSRNRVHTERI